MEMQQEKQDSSSQQSIIFVCEYETRILNAAVEEKKHIILSTRWIRKNKI
jgi:hypothetical protein